MAFDIYGNYLAQGHCEVHSWIAEGYPCFKCVEEIQQAHYRKEMETQIEAEYYAEQMRIEKEKSC